MPIHSQHVSNNVNPDLLTKPIANRVYVLILENTFNSNTMKVRFKLVHLYLSHVLIFKSVLVVHKTKVLLLESIWILLVPTLINVILQPLSLQPVAMESTLIIMGMSLVFVTLYMNSP